MNASKVTDHRDPYGNIAGLLANLSDEQTAFMVRDLQEQEGTLSADGLTMLELGRERLQAAAEARGDG